MGNFKDIMFEDIRFLNNTRRSVINTKNGLVSKEEYVYDLKKCWLLKYENPKSDTHASRLKQEFITKYGFWNWY